MSLVDDEEVPSVRRLPASGFHVAIELAHAGEHTLWADMTLDLSTGGVFVATFHPLPIGTVAHLLLTIEGDGIPIAAEGVVRWTRSHREGSDGVAGVGIRFTKIDDAALAKLERFAADVREPEIFEVDEAAGQAKRSVRPPRSA